MSKTFKAKSVLIAIFTMIMALSLVVGIGFNGSAEAKAEDETATTKWQTSRSTPLQELNGSGIQYQNISATIMNGTNILDVPGRTVKFQFRMNGVAAPWQGFAFLNGQNEWKKVAWTGELGAACDTLPHIIIDPVGNAQVYANSTSSIYGAPAVGVEGMKALTDTLHTVEIHIGDGETDNSYLKIDGSELTQQGAPGVSAIKWATVDKFTEGCYFAVTYNANPDCVVMLGEYNTPYTEGASAGFKYVDLSSGTAPEGLEFVAKNITGTAKLYVNGTEVTDTTTYTVTDVEGGKKYVLNQNFWTVYLSSLKKSTAIYVEAENGKGAVVATVQLAPPPVWKGESYKEIKSGDSLSYTFEYTGATLSADSITVKTGIRTAKNAIVPETDYTLTNEGTTYTIAFTSEYLAKAFETYNSFSFSVTVGEDTLNGDVYCIPEAEGWYARSVDLADGELTTEGNYVSDTFVKFSADTLASRLIYNTGIDVTKPITLEFETIDPNFIWALLGVMDSRKTFDYFSNETANESKLTTIFFGEKSETQKIGGFVAGGSTNASYANTAGAYKNIVVEMYFGTKQEESYFRVNGMDCGTPTAVQSDFKGGKAYIGFFFNYTVGNFNFKVNKDVNGIGVTAPNTEASFKQDLAKATDLVLDVIGTDGNVEVVNSKGTVSTAEEIAYANGKLTIKAAYFARLAFTKNDVLTIKDKTSGTATEIKMAYTTSNMAGSVVAFATKGNVKDAVFALPEGITEVSSVSKGDLELTAANFSVSDGKLTIDKSQIKDTVKMNEFIVISGNKVVTAYVYVDEFANGYAKGGSGTIEADGKAFVMTNAAKATPEKVFDLKTGFVMKIDFQAIATYYHSTNNYQNPTAITFNFYDPYSGLTLIYKIYANYEADDANATDTALFEEYNLVDSEGRTVSGVSGTRPLSMVDSQNTAALGAHKVKFEAAGDGLKITVDDGRATTIASLGNFNANANILTVESSASVGDKESKVAFKLYDLDEEFDYESVKVEEKKPDDSSSSGEATGCNEGCKGSATATGLFGVLTVVAYTIVRKKRG